jgi:hypothetical protein
MKKSDIDNWKCEKDGKTAENQMIKPAYAGTALEQKPIRVDHEREKRLIAMMEREKMNRKKENEE